MIKVLGRGKWTTCKMANSEFQIELQIQLLAEIIKHNFEKNTDLNTVFGSTRSRILKTICLFLT